MDNSNTLSSQPFTYDQLYEAGIGNRTYLPMPGPMKEAWKLSLKAVGIPQVDNWRAHLIRDVRGLCVCSTKKAQLEMIIEEVGVAIKIVELDRCARYSGIRSKHARDKVRHEQTFELSPILDHQFCVAGARYACMYLVWKTLFGLSQFQLKMLCAVHLLAAEWAFSAVSHLNGLDAPSGETPLFADLIAKLENVEEERATLEDLAVTALRGDAVHLGEISTLLRKTGTVRLDTQNRIIKILNGSFHA